MSQVEVEQQQQHQHPQIHDEVAENSEAQQEDEQHQEPAGNEAKQHQLDLRYPGSFDCCWQMLAQKIMAPTFWLSAELFLSISAPLGGHQSVRETLAQHLRRLFGIFPRWDELFLVPNEFVALEAFVQGFCSSGDVFLCPAPLAEPELASTLSRAEVELRLVQLGENVELNLADLERVKLSAEGEGRRVRALLLHNPHPLLGSIRGGDRRLARILEWISERDLYLLVDESLATFDLWEFNSCLGLDHRGQFGQKLVWLWSGAKHLSLPGLEFAAIVVPKPERLEPFLQTRPCAPLVQFLTAKLLEDFDWASELFARRKSRLDELRRLTLEGLAGMGIRAMEIDSYTGTQWILADLRKFLPTTNADSERSLREEFAQKGRLLLISSEQLCMDEYGWFRLIVGQSEDQVGIVLDGLRAVLEQKRRDSAVEWEQVDMSKYGGKGIAWEAVDATEENAVDADAGIIDETMQSEMEETKSEEQQEEDGLLSNALEATEKEWKFPENSMNPQEVASPHTSLFAQDFWLTEDQRRMSIIREEEEENELLRQVFIYEKKQTTGAVGQNEDEVMREVFDIFPAERLRWKTPLVEAREISNKEHIEKQQQIPETVTEEELPEIKEEQKKLNELELIEEHEFVEIRKTVEVDTRDGLDAERAQVEAEYKPTVQAMLTDFSFIEELVRSSYSDDAVAWSGTTLKEVVDTNEFYDEASTEEEEKEQQQQEEEYTPISPRFQQPLTIDVPLLIGQPEEETRRDFEDSSDSRRIIEIIDQIFHEAVQIQDFSSSSDDTHPNQAVTIRQEHWSRSDSGLAAESPPDMSFSPMMEAGHHLQSIAERTENSMEIESPEPTRNEQMLFETFHEAPLQTSTLAREKLEERHLGPTAQMLDDSGIFVEMPPGSLSIDFPLLIPVEHLKAGKVDDGIEEQTLHRQKQLDEVEDNKLTIDLRFKSVFDEEELMKLVASQELRTEDDLVLMEHDQQIISGTTTVQFPEDLDTRIEQTEFEEIGWRPLENLEEPMQEVHRIQVDTVKLDEQPEYSAIDEQFALAAMLNEGSAFCPTPSPVEKVSHVKFQTEADGESVSGVQLWKPLDQLEEPLKTEQIATEESTKNRVEDNKKFSETLDELEASQQSTSEDYYKSSLIEETKNGTIIEIRDPKRSKEAIDVVAEWNASRMAQKKAEEQTEPHEVEANFNINEQSDWAAHSQVIFPAAGVARTERNIEAWEEPKSKVEEVHEGEDFVKTLVKMEVPKKPPRSAMTTGQKLERQNELDGFEESQRHMQQEEASPESSPAGPFSALQEIPGRSGGYQVHHRMQMRRRESRKHRTKSRDRVVLEHMNITEVDYLGGFSERIERGERLVTCISTKINRFTPDEFFRRLQFEGMSELDEERERLKKYVEVRKRRSQSVPDILAQQDGKEIGRTVTKTVTIQRLDDEAEINQAKATGELHCRVDVDPGEDKAGNNATEQIFLTCRNPEHSAKGDHCDPQRLYRVRRSTMMSENGYKNMKRRHEALPELYSEFETRNYNMEEEPEVVRSATAKHKYRRPRRPRSPARITVTTTRNGGAVPGESIDRVTVRHTPGSNWIVSSIYRTTEFGWERTTLKKPVPGVAI